MKKLTVLVVGVTVLISGFCYWQYELYSRSNNIVDFLIEAGEVCKSKDDSICAVLPATKRNLDNYLSKLISPVASKVGDDGRYASVMRLMEETKSKSDLELQKSENEAKFIEQEKENLKLMNKGAAEAAKSTEQGLIQFRAEYEQLARPKLLYSCDGKVAYMAGKGFSNYNDLYEKAKGECPDGWEFRVLNSDK